MHHVTSSVRVCFPAPPSPDPYPQTLPPTHATPRAPLCVCVIITQAELAPVLLQLQPRLVLQALDYAAAARTRAEALDAAAGGPCTLPLRQLVLEAFKRHGVPLSCSLGSLLPVIDLRCPGVSLVAPRRGVDTLEPAVTRASPAASASQETHRVSGTAAGGGGGGGGADGTSSSSSSNKNQQAPHRGEVRLIAQLSGLHAAVGYCSSCFGSLLQQVDATADLALSFEHPPKT